MLLCETYPPPTFQSRERLGASPLSRGRDTALPFAGRERGWVQALYNHHLGDTWHGEWSGTKQPFVFFPGTGSSRPLAASVSSP